MSEEKVLDDPNVTEDVARCCEAWAESSDRHVFPKRAAALRDLAATIRRASPTPPTTEGREAIRREALEEAAKVADHHVQFGWAMPGDVARAIRSLSPPDGDGKQEQATRASGPTAPTDLLQSKDSYK